MLLDIFFNEIYPYSSSLIKRRRVSLSLVKKFARFKKTKKQNLITLNIEKEKLERKIFFLEKILSERKKNILKIQSHIRKYLIYKKYKKFILIKNFLEKRNKYISLIQSHFKTFLMHKHFKKLLENEALFFYKFPLDLIDKLFLISNQNEEIKKKAKNNQLNLSMQIKSPKLILDFKYSKYLDSYYLPIKKIKLFKKHIYITFKVNGENILDPRYSIINDNNGNFYNVITPKMIYRKMKGRPIQQKFEEEKQWEELFMLKKHKRTFSYDASSISSKTDISKELNKNLGENYFQQNSVNNNNSNDKNKPIRSILKHKSVKHNHPITEKKVSFQSKIEFCV